MELKEIRINQQYTSLLSSEYPLTEQDESIPKTRERVLPSALFYSKLLSNTDETKAKENILPMYCRFKKEYKNHHIYVLEEPPAFRTISLSLDLTRELAEIEADGKLEEYGYENLQVSLNNSQGYSVTLAMPFSIFIVGVKLSGFNVVGACFFFRTHPLIGMDDYLNIAPLLNIAPEQAVCFGNDVGADNRSIVAAIEQARSSWWTSTFNTDYTYNYEEYQHTPMVSNYLVWQHCSQADPMFVYGVEWLKHKHTLKQTIDHFAKEYGMTHVEGNSTSNIFNAFQKPFTLGKEEVINGMPSKLYYDTCSGIYIEDIHISVGDSFSYKGETLFIEAFGNYGHECEANHILLRRAGKQFAFKLTKKSRQFLKEKIIEQRYLPEVITPTGVTLKANQIVSMNSLLGAKKYRKVHYIRPAIDGRQEVCMGSSFYLLENLTEPMEIINTENPTIWGIQVNKDDEYVYCQWDRSPMPFARTYACKFTGIEPTRRGDLELIFKTDNDNSYTIQMNNQERQQLIFEKQKLQEVPKIVALGRRLFHNKNYDTGELINQYTNGETTFFDLNGDMQNPVHDDIVNEFINGDTFKVYINNAYMEFKIGDKVVVADWSQPLDILNVKTITGFEDDKPVRKINFILQNKYGVESKVEYIDSGNGRILTGKVRKITNEFSGVPAGSKIIAQNTGISCFPKKDTNIIIGFLTDTGIDEPLVLCSNGCTLWFNHMMMNFEIIPSNTDAWNKKQHAPLDPRKIKIQPGDIVLGTGSYRNTYGYLLYRDRLYRRLKCMLLEYPTRLESYIVDSYISSSVMLDCIPNPRYTEKQRNELGYITGYPNFNGMIIPSTQDNRCMYIDEQRSPTDV